MQGKILFLLNVYISFIPLYNLSILGEAAQYVHGS